MRIYPKNNRAKFHPDPIWNNRVLGFLKRSLQQEKEQEEKQEQEEEEYRNEISSWSNKIAAVADLVQSIDFVW